MAQIAVYPRLGTTAVDANGIMITEVGRICDESAYINALIFDGVLLTYDPRGFSQPAPASTSSSGTGGAPVSANYLVTALDGTLTHEKVLTAGSGITLVETDSALTISSTGGSGGAPINSTYVTLTSDSTLTNESVLTAGAGISITPGSGIVTIAATAATAAPAAAQYVTLATDATLTNERALTAGANITLTDGGPGGTLTIAATGVGAPIGAQYVTLAADATLTSERVLTAGTGITITPAAGTVTIAATGSGGGAPTTTPYVTLATDAGLTSERVLTAGPSVTITDAGAGGNVVVDAPLIKSSSFVTIGSNPSLTNSRSLAVGAGLTLTDGGAAGSATLALSGALAPLNASYLVTAPDGTLTNEQVLTAGSGISFLAGTGTLTVSATSSGASSFLNVLDAGVLQGTLANNTARTSNTTKFNAAVASAISSNKILLVPPGTYELYGAVVINSNNFRWFGTMNSILLQYNLAAPVMHVGPTNGTAAAVCFGVTLDGVQLKYAGTATSTGRAFEGSSLYQCSIKNMLIGDVFQAVGTRTSVPYIGFWLDDAAGTTACFSNVFENIQINFYQYRGFSQDRLDYSNATGNVITNLYVRGGGNGGVQDISSVSGSAGVVITSQTQLIVNQLNIEWSTMQNMMLLVDCNQSIFNSCNFEGITIKSPSSQVAAFVDTYQGQVTFNGATLHTAAIMAANNQSAGGMFRVGDDAQLTRLNCRAYSITTDVSWYTVVGNSPNGARVHCTDLDFANGGVFTAFDGGVNGVGNSYWGTIADFNGGGYQVLSDADQTVYAYRGWTSASIPTTTATRNITMARACSASIATIIPPGVRRRIRNTGTTSMVVKNYNGTTLVTISSGGGGAEIVFNGTDWVVY